MAIPEQFIDELVARSEISDVVSSYVSLMIRSYNLNCSGVKAARSDSGVREKSVGRIAS